eukprot:GILK01011995.1.p1 GENE.GILK01011995.1~~GILK01011995.1.p1  ORF type:complete len:236 (+),score=36.29 GILK01011995.1:37-744(+)
MCAAKLLKSAILRTNVKHRPSPTLFYFPGITSKSWHDSSEPHFKWTKQLEDNVDVIKKEYLELRDKGFASDYHVKDDEHKLHEGSWDWFNFIDKGKKQDKFRQACPDTTRLLENVPGLFTDTPFGFAFFSTLKPGSHIAPHCSPCNLRIRCHFPLIVPPYCGIRVADEERVWQEGKCLLFDDSYEHEVWHQGEVNEGAQERVVLLFDIWHWEITDAERQSIIDMFGYAKTQGWMK